MGTRHREAENTSLKIWRLVIDKTFLTSLAASLHAAGLQDEQHNLVSQPSLDPGELHWVEEVVKCATVLDTYWGNDSSQRVAPRENDFNPPTRFQDLAPIGHGGMGVVYSALDTQANETVAIKVGKSIDESSDFIKQEFRTLAAIRHPNLVVLKELHQFGESVFFTMEYIHGDIFNSQSVAQKVEGSPWKPEQLTELSDQLLQLVNGIDFLHSHGYVHCDIKPSNILITEVGRVVILDLGLARPFLSGQQRRAKCIGGTAAYMSPEQASVESPTPASDWFSFGVIMFETLFGHRPFQGTAVDILFAKLASNPVLPPENIGVPEPLSDLCLKLLNPDTDARPTVEEIRQCLECFSSQSRTTSGTPAPLPSFLGRKKELAILDHAWEDAIKGSDPALVFVEGESGIGKTYLVQKFLENLQDCSETIVLSGRCYENERIPYKAIDAVVGEMAIQWRAHGDPDAIDPLLTNAISAVFKSFSYCSEEESVATEIPHATQTAAGLHAILQALSAKGKKIILFIDDVQWADADSGELLCKMIRGLPLLLICSHRPMETPNPFMVQLEDEFQTSKNAVKAVRQVEIAPFNDGDAALFFEFCFPDLDKHVFGEAIAASAGVPMFLTSLIQQIQEMPDVQVKANNLDWTTGLDPQAKRLLNLVCASGYPLPQSIAKKAAQVDKHWEASISALCSRQLITFAQADGEMALTPFHDMIRESVYTKLDASQKKAIHSTIGTISEGEAGVPPDRLAFHFHEAGDLAKFCRYSISAGDVAAKSQAFSGAVRAYSEAFENFIGTDEDKRDLKQKLAFSLGRLGRASESGDLYLELASESDEDLEFLKLSAYQFCVAGRIKDALQGFDRLLRPWGYTTRLSERSVLLRLAWLRLKLRVSDATNWLKNNIHFAQPTGGPSVAMGLVANGEVQGGSLSDKPNPNRIRLCDLLWDTGIAFTFFDMMKAGLFIHYSQQVALQEGDEVRILRGNMMRANHEAMCGSNKEKLVKKLLDSSNTPVTKRIPYLTGLHLLSSRMAAHSLGQWEMSSEKCSKAEEYFRDNCEKLALFEGKSIPHLDQMGIGAAQLFGILGLQFSGQYRAMIARYKELLAAPENRENLLNRSNLAMFVGPYVCLAENKPAQAHALLDEAIKMWPADKFCFQHIIAGYVHVEIYLYEGDYQAASETVEKLWKKARWSTHFCFEIIRVLFLEVRGRCAIERFDSAQRGAAEKIAHRAIRKLEKEKTAWARPMAQKIRAGIELKKQNLEAATLALTAARDGFKQCNMEHFQYPAEAKLCEITGQLETKRFQAVQDWFESQEIKNQKAYVEMQYPNQRK